MRQDILKSSVFIVLLLAVLIINTPEVRADSTCRLTSELINQDPHPAIAGDYVEVLFQINPTGNCENGVTVKLVPEYPFTLDTGDYTKVIEQGTYAGDNVNSAWNIVYKLRVDKDALEGDYELKLEYHEGKSSTAETFFRRFDIAVEDGLTDFEVHIQNYNVAQKELTFEILNIGNQDIEALTVEVPKQKNIEVKGSNRNIVGDLDSNEYTTASFEAVPQEGSIMLKLYYTDSINERRVIEKAVEYDSSYFADSLENKPANGSTGYIITAVIVLLVGFFIFRKIKKKRSSKNKKRDFSV